MDKIEIDEIEIDEISEKQADAMIDLFTCDEECSVSYEFRVMIIERWITAGYIKRKLKPCPLTCNGQIELWYEDNMNGITCNECGLELTHKVKKNLIDAWNMRT